MAASLYERFLGENMDVEAGETQLSPDQVLHLVFVFARDFLTGADKATARARIVAALKLGPVAEQQVVDLATAVLQGNDILGRTAVSSGTAAEKLAAQMDRAKLVQFFLGPFQCRYRNWDPVNGEGPLLLGAPYTSEAELRAALGLP
jgi:hypothetical protein